MRQDRLCSNDLPALHASVTALLHFPAIISHYTVLASALKHDLCRCSAHLCLCLLQSCDTSNGTHITAAQLHATSALVPDVAMTANNSV